MEERSNDDKGGDNTSHNEERHIFQALSISSRHIPPFSWKDSKE
jgi:hypothetical protein